MNANCPTCEKNHTVDATTLERFGPDAECMPCIDRKHVKFMRTTGAKLKLTCNCMVCRGGA
jgi:hypothetical protein